MSGSVDVRSLVLGQIADAARNRPRSLQKTIGPSQVGLTCLYHLALAWLGERVQGAGGWWYPFIGTAVHAELARIFGQQPDRYLVEYDVMVGCAGGREISGTCDLFIRQTRTCLDFKVVGAQTLRSAKSGPSAQYRTQVHLYGRGLVNAGHDVRDVAIAYLPRNAPTLDQAVFWTEPYDEQVAVDALDRLDHLAEALSTLAGISDDAMRLYLDHLPRDRAHCFDCSRELAVTNPLLALSA